MTNPTLAPMPVIVGSPRSGTTLLRFMLDAHPELAIPPETGFLALPEFAGDERAIREQFFRAVTHYPPEAPGWGDFGIPREDFRVRLGEIENFTPAAGFRMFYRLYAARFDKPRWGDKTPLYCMHLERISTLLPEARFVHIVRDGRDVALSLREMWFSPGREIETQAAHWCRCVQSARAQGARCQHYLEVRYEDLILDTEKTLAHICAFLELDFDGAMLRYHERTPERLREHGGRTLPDGRVLLTHEQRLRQQWLSTKTPNRSRVFAWKRGMDTEERVRFEQIAGRLLCDLGYEI